MTLRFRLALSYTLLVTLILIASGVGTRILLSRSLRQGLDEGLRSSAELLAGFIETEDDDGDVPSLHVEGAAPEQLRAGLVALLLHPEDGVLDTLGDPPDLLPPPIPGLSDFGEWHVWQRQVGTLTLVTMQRTDGLGDSLRRFDTVILILSPLAIVVAFVLGYVLAAGALVPIARLTRSAYDLAQRRAWRERLPVPRRQDELWQLTQATNTLLAKLEEVIESERRFTADAAHEVRTPLTVLRGWLEKAVEDTSEPETRRAVTKAMRAGDELMTLIEKLLVLARTEAGQGLVVEPVALAAVASDVGELLRPRFEDKGIELVVEVPSRPTWVRGDRTSLELATRNLLENALRFTDRGRVDLGVVIDGRTISLIIEDTGPGIPDEALPRLFHRFYQADVRHRREGSGLGLALVASVAKWHGGEVRADNRAEGGARFTLTLPLEP